MAPVLRCRGEAEDANPARGGHLPVRVIRGEEKHTIACYGHVAAKSAPPVVLELVDLEGALPPLGPDGRGRGRGRRMLIKSEI
jgi:hypothetical protein